MTEQRQSNIELLRIVAMMLVLILHANGIALGLPEQADCISNPGLSFLRFSIESLCIVCVNVYVLISGWFGIRTTPRKLAFLLFTCLFYSLLLTAIIWAAKGFPSISLKTLAGCFLFGQDYWFANSYLLLCIISPALNLLFEYSDRKTARFTVCAFLLVMVTFGWLHTMPEFKFGYSTISFIGLYLLGRYMRCYVFDSDNKTFNKYVAIAGYLACSILLALMAFLVYRRGLSYVITRCVFSYLNPLTIAATVFLFLFFREMKFNSSFVNTVAKSSFAVYLFHLNPFIWDMYLGLCRNFTHQHGMFAPIFIAGLILTVFATGTLIDRVRIKCWTLLDNRLIKKTQGL
ncbi:MAG: acyltransferase [Bacteroidales bacterium]|nr:acyltransferase [Bacteroidales bacterium]